MDAMWWLLVTVAVAWHAREAVRHWRIVSRRIDDDVATLNRDPARRAEHEEVAAQ